MWWGQASGFRKRSNKNVETCDVLVYGTDITAESFLSTERRSKANGDESIQKLISGIRHPMCVP